MFLQFWSFYILSLIRFASLPPRTNHSLSPSESNFYLSSYFCQCFDKGHIYSIDQHFPNYVQTVSGGFHEKYKTSGQIFGDKHVWIICFYGLWIPRAGSFFHKKSGDTAIHSSTTQNIDSKMLTWTNYCCPGISVKLQLAGWRFCIYCPQERDYVVQSKEKGNQFLQFEFQTLRELMGNRLWRTWVRANLPTFRLDKKEGRGNSQRVSERVSTYVGTWKGDPGPSPFTSSVLSHDGGRGNRNSRRFGGAENQGNLCLPGKMEPWEKNKTVNKKAKI